MKRTFALGLMLMMPACGLRPVYSGGSAGVAATALSQIEIAPIADRAGYLVRASLRQRLGEPSEVPKFNLEVELDDQILGFGVRGDNSIARERRTLRARYRLRSAADGAVIVDATATADVGIDRVSSDYAVVAAENTALERLATDLAGQIALRVAIAAKSGVLVGQ